MYVNVPRYEEMGFTATEIEAIERHVAAAHAAGTFDITAAQVRPALDKYPQYVCLTEAEIIGVLRPRAWPLVGEIKPACKHVMVRVGDKEEAIDERIAAVVAEVWKLGIDTGPCIGDYEDDLDRHANFELVCYNERDLLCFLSIIANHSVDLDLYYDIVHDEEEQAMDSRCRIRARVYDLNEPCQDRHDDCDTEEGDDDEVANHDDEDNDLDGNAIQNGNEEEDEEYDEVHSSYCGPRLYLEYSLVVPSRHVAEIVRKLQAYSQVVHGVRWKQGVYVWDWDRSSAQQAESLAAEEQSDDKGLADEMKSDGPTGLPDDGFKAPSVKEPDNEAQETTRESKHKQVLVAVGDQKDEIDELLVPLIIELWKAGVRTHMSCQECWPGTVWIEFKSAEDLIRFLGFVAVFEAGVDSLYNRIMGVLHCADGSDPAGLWEYSMYLDDYGYDAELDEQAEEELCNFFILVSVRFPMSDLPYLEAQMRNMNDAGFGHS